jgi:hypothetical protein
MNKKKRIESSEDLVNAVEELFDQTLMDVPEEANTVLKEAGYDPDAVGKKMEAIARRAMSNSPLNWRNRARQELEKERSRLGGVSPLPPRSRTEMLAAIEKLRSRLGGRKLASVFFRNFEQATDDDLAGILEELEFLANQTDDEA